MIIISGGQTGADRGGLDVALNLGIVHRGWCPAGRRAEDGVIPEVYQLKETRQSNYRVRTELNVADSDVTLIFTYGALTGGSLETWEYTQKQNKPFLWIDLDVPGDYVPTVLAFLQQHDPGAVNVAGNRESKAVGINIRVRDLLTQVLQQYLGIDPVRTWP